MTLQHPKSFKLSILFFLSLLLLFAHYAFAQYPITKVHGSFCSGSEAGFIIAASSCSYVNWSASGAQILEQNGTYVRVKWTSTSAQISCSYYCNYQSGSSYSPWYSISSPATPSVSISANKNNVCSGTSITFTATPTNGGSSPYYNWRVNGTTASGATNSRYYTTSSLSNNDVVTCIMNTSLECYTQYSATSNGLTMTITPKQVMTVAVQGPSSVCSGSTASFYALVGNGAGTLTYQWFKNGSTVGTNSQYFSTSAVVNGDNISCRVTSSDPCVQSPVTSANFTVTVTGIQTFSAGINPGEINICSGSNVTLTATSSHPASSYQWQMNGSNVSGQTSNTFTTSASTDTQLKSVRVIVTTSAGCVNQTTATGSAQDIPFTIKPLPNASITGPDTGCGSVALQASTGTGYSWAWKNSGGTTVGTTSGYTATASDSYTVTTTLNGCSKISSAKAVNIIAIPIAPTGLSASNRTKNSFSANWGSVSGASGYRLDVSTSSTFSSFVSGYNNLAISGTSRSVTGLNSNTQYYFRIRTEKGGCTSGNSSNGSVTTLLTEPVTSASTAFTTTSLTVNWGAVTGATSYQLDVSPVNTFASFVSGYNNLTVSGTSQNVTGLLAGTTYYLRVRAVNASGTSANSATGSSPTLTTAPTLSASTAFTTTSLTVNWGAVTGATSYRLDVSTVNTFASFVSGYNNLTVSGTSQNVTGLLAGTTYYYRVRAVNASGASANSATGSSSTLASAPTFSASTAFTTTSFTVNWGTVTGATSYRMDVSTVNTFASFVSGYNNLTVSGTSRNVTGLLAGTTYYFRVRAVNASGTSVNSATGSSPTLTTAPTLSASTAFTTTSFTVNWGAVTGATSYRLDVSTVNTFASYVSGYNNLTVSGTSRSVTGLLAGTTYYFRVRAVNASGTSTNSTTGSSPTLTSAPTLSASTALTMTSFTVNWGAVTGATSYKLDVSTVNTFASFVSGYNNLMVSGTSRNVTGLSANTTYYVRMRAVNGSGTSANSTTSSSLTLPAAPNTPATFTFCEWESKTLTTTGYPSGGTLRWYNSSGTELLYTGLNFILGNMAPGTYTYRIKSQNSTGESSAYAVATLVVSVDCDQKLNWSKTTSYGIDGSEVASAIQYTDGFGNPMQSQSKAYTANQVFASQPLYDRLGNASASTLPAPINGSAFSYRHNFVTNASGQRYGSDDFDLPAGSGQGSYNDPKPVADEGIGTLGWYYSTNNTMEPATPTTSYPYARSYTAEGPNPTTSKSTGPGNAYKFGSGKEVTSDRYPIQVGELDHYFNIRRHLVPTSTPYSANLLASVTTANTSQFTAVSSSVTASGGYINVTCNSASGTPGVFPIGGDIAVTANKNYTFRVKGYRVSSSNVNLRVTTAGGTVIQWPGALLPSGSTNEGWVSTTFTVPAGVTSIRVGVTWSQPTVGHSIKISGVELKAEVPTASIGYKYISTDPDGKRTASFVDIEGRALASALVTSSTGTPPTSFTYDYWSYSYYNELGQLVASVAPNGVNTANTNAPTFVTTYKYDHMGRLIETTTPDEGTSQFVYSLDGKIRFSQNQLQRDASPKRFSYTNYDYYGRLVESGEYTSSGTNPFVFQPHTVTTPGTYSVLTIVDKVLPQGKTIEDVNSGNYVSYLGLTAKGDAIRCKDYAYMVYDVAGSDYPSDALHTAQKIKFGQLSKTENALSKTWYSYNEFGEVVWTKQSATTVGDKTVDYTYDYLGKVTDVAYQKGQTDAFYHHYTYDSDQRLTEVRTSTDGANKTLHARYKYYLHGPLKRVEIAGKKQGIDYVYTISGALKAINSGDPSKDLGQDGISGPNATFMKDLFGETFHYYDNDYTATHITESVNLTGANPAYAGLYGGLPRAIGYHNVTDKDASGNKMHIYGYQYDDRNQLSDARWGSVSGTTATFTTNQQENISGYDKNGNIQALLRKGKTGQTMGNYGYVYEPNTNKLDKVNHNGTLLTDYTYNALGQMTKQVEGANTFNYTYTPYGKVKDVRNASNQLVQSYHYDDRGGLLKKVSYNAGTATKETYYISDASGNTLSVYEKPMPSGSVTQAEVSVYGAGRLATFKPADKFFYYEINDHQGSVRVVMGVSLPDKIVGTLETANAAQDRANFLRYDNAKRINAAIFDRTNGNNPGYSQRLNGGTNEKYGMAKSLAVNAGDTVLMEVYAKYVDRTTPGQWSGALATLMGQILSGAAGVVTEGATYSSSTSSFPVGNIVNNSGSTGAGPKVFLNYLSFDAGYVAITDPSQSNFIRITTAAKETGGDITHERMYAQVVVKQAGYMYIYYSNEDATGNYEAYFDDFTVTHTKFKVYKAEDYYPFGLAMDGNTFTDPYRYGYQGQYSEKDATTGLNEFELRMYDARFGRWISPDPYGQYFSPYVGMGNSPVIRMDPDGGLDIPTIEIPGLTITGSRMSTATTAIKSALSSLGRIALTDWYVPAGTKGYTKDAEWFKDNPGSGWEWIGNDDHQFLTESLLLSDLEFSSGMSKKGADLMRAGRIMGIYQAQEDFIQNDITQATIFAAGLLTGGSEAILLARVGRLVKPASKLVGPLIRKDVITQMTRRGKPVWKTVQRRYWQLVNKSNTPSRNALVKLNDGTIVSKKVYKELHHIHGRGGTNPHRASNLEEYWPWEHAIKDSDRYIKYDFIKWID